ncbi:hypothetical protein MBLNU457_1871t2 [Dothideomycetes sp. NU457]
MSLFPRFAAGEFAPLFRLLDDYATHQLTRPSFPAVPALRTFQPRFDVREAKDSYELHGELPGIDQKDIAIEFTDESTLSIRGRTERHEERGTRPQPQAAVEGQPEQHKLTDGNNYHKATVEDDTGMNMSGANPDAASDTPTASEAKTPSESQMTQTETQTETQQEQQPQSRYWVSERSVGEFSRTFNFPSRVDQENVKASLKNGILSIIVPKAQAPASRRINIE